MLIALDENGNRISAEKAEKGHAYHCPICRSTVTLKHGSVVAPYFSHEAKRCSDRWHYDTTEWHLAMQQRFPEEQREIVIRHNGETHRADILCGNQLIEFQHSPISAAEITERNSFYHAAGYQVAWVFDLQDQKECGKIAPYDKMSGNGYKWTRPKTSLKCFPQPTKNDRSLVIYFYWKSYGGEEYFERVIWSSNDGTGPNFKYFLSASNGIYTRSAKDALTVSDFFITDADRLAAHLAEIPVRHTVKCSGQRGRPRDQYVCPRTGTFGVKRFGERGCSYCRYCAAIEDIPGGFHAYCCYPNQVNEVDEIHPGYESSGVPVF